MHPYCIKCPEFIENNNIKIKREMDRKTNLFARMPRVYRKQQYKNKT